MTVNMFVRAASSTALLLRRFDDKIVTNKGIAYQARDHYYGGEDTSQVTSLNCAVTRISIDYRLCAGHRIVEFVNEL